MVSRDVYGNEEIKDLRYSSDHSDQYDDETVVVNKADSAKISQDRRRAFNERGTEREDSDNNDEYNEDRNANRDGRGGNRGANRGNRGGRGGNRGGRGGGHVVRVVSPTSN